MCFFAYEKKYYFSRFLFSAEFQYVKKDILYQIKADQVGMSWENIKIEIFVFINQIQMQDFYSELIRLLLGEIIID